MLTSGNIYRHGTAWRVLFALDAFDSKTRWILFSSLNGEQTFTADAARMESYLAGDNPNRAAMELAGHISQILPPASSNFTPNQLGGDLLQRILVELKGVGADKVLHITTSLMLQLGQAESKSAAGGMLKAFATGLAVGIAKEVNDAGAAGKSVIMTCESLQHAADSIDLAIETKPLDDGDLVADLIGLGLMLVTEGVRQLRLANGTHGTDRTDGRPA